MQDTIENIAFYRFVNQTIPFEFITIQELYKRCKESKYDLSNLHRIKFHALLIITEGESTHTLDFKKQVLSPGVILPIAKDQVHAFNKERTVNGYVISFEETFITKNMSEKNLFHFLHIYHTPSIVIGKENLESLTIFINLLKSLHKDSNTQLKPEIISAIFMALLFQIKRLSIYKHKTFETKRFKDFIRFKQLITECYNQTHNVKDYANKIGVSYKYLNDISKEISNSTAKAFLDNWLLLETKRNITENSYTSQEIAYKMGFKEPSNFIRFFKKFTRLTPNQFQKIMQKPQSVID